MFILSIVVIAIILVVVLTNSGGPAVGPQTKTAKARSTRKVAVEITSRDLASAKAKIRAAVRERLPDLVQKRSAGIYLGRDGVPNASGWNAHCQEFMDKVVLPLLTPRERLEVISAGLSELATELVENAVKYECLRHSRTDRTLPAILNLSVPGSYRTDVPAVTASFRSGRPAVRSATPRAAGSGRITRGLIIRPEPIEKILNGTKSWEMRSRPVEIRGTIALVKKGSKAVYGVADIVDCRGPLSLSERLASERQHGISPDRWSDPDVSKYEYAWVLANVRRLKHPVPYVHKGGVQFVTLDETVSAQIERAL